MSTFLKVVAAVGLVGLVAIMLSTSFPNGQQPEQSTQQSEAQR